VDWQKKAGSMVQVEEQPSPSAVLLSSHCSAPMMIPSPHLVTQVFELSTTYPVTQVLQTTPPETTLQVTQLVTTEQLASQAVLVELNW